MACALAYPRPQRPDIQCGGVCCVSSGYYLSAKNAPCSTLGAPLGARRAEPPGAVCAVPRGILRRAAWDIAPCRVGYCAVPRGILRHAV
jgi:hypothetical protein